MSDSPLPPTYTVLVDDNFCYMDADARYELGTFATFEAALAACRTIVQRFLDDAFRPGTTAAELIERYRRFGEDPFIRGPPGVSLPFRFSGWSYACEYAKRVCGSTPPT